LLPKYQQWASARLIENALAVPPHYLYCLRVCDSLLRRAASLAIEQRKNQIYKPYPSALIKSWQAGLARVALCCLALADTSGWVM